ncbi:MAG TPA: hypothetical protein VFK27_02960 [Bacillales bacterium]|nr:hypothetical protein [Bacillales bacterium]
MKDHYKHVYEGRDIDGGAFVRLPNLLQLYTITNHADKKEDREEWMDEGETYKDYAIEPATLDVYRALYQHRNTNAEHKHYGKAWPSQQRLAIEQGMTDKTIRKHIRKLSWVGLIEVERKYRNSRPFHVYTFPQPLGVESFRAKFPKACFNYERKMDALKQAEAVEPTVDFETGEVMDEKSEPDFDLDYI